MLQHQTSICCTCDACKHRLRRRTGWLQGAVQQYSGRNSMGREVRRTCSQASPTSPCLERRRKFQVYYCRTPTVICRCEFPSILKVVSASWTPPRPLWPWAAPSDAAACCAAQGTRRQQREFWMFCKREKRLCAKAQPWLCTGGRAIEP